MQKKRETKFNLEIQNQFCHLSREVLGCDLCSLKKILPSFYHRWETSELELSNRIDSNYIRRINDVCENLRGRGLSSICTFEMRKSGHSLALTLRMVPDFLPMVRCSRHDLHLASTRCKNDILFSFGCTRKLQPQEQIKPRPFWEFRFRRGHVDVVVTAASQPGRFYHLPGSWKYDSPLLPPLSPRFSFSTRISGLVTGLDVGVLFNSVCYWQVVFFS